MDEASVTHAALDARSVTKVYGKTKVLDALDISIVHGSTLALIGRSGAGKSTLLRCLDLISLPDSGELMLEGQRYFADGRALFEPWEVRRQIGLVLQNYPLFPNLTVLGNLSLALRTNRMVKKAEIHAIIDPVATALGITNLYTQYPAKLSGGQAQRCAIARALVLRPKVLLLDEITSALDPSSINDVVATIRLIRDAPGAQKMTLVLVTHLLGFAESFADDIAFMNAGTIWERHKAREFRKEAYRFETRRFLEGQPNGLL